jgi:S-DNA-T family DNA segregation ATPase FtsK/SpoIIIE
MSKRGRKKKFKLDLSSGIFRSVVAISLFVASGLSAISFFAPDYALNSQIQSSLRSILGFSAIFVPPIFLVLALMSFESYKVRFANPRILFGLIGVCISVAGLFHLFYGDNALEMAQSGYGGGFLGYQLDQLLRNTVSVYGGFLLLVAALIISALVLLNTSIDALFQKSAVVSTFLKEKLHISRTSGEKSDDVNVLPLEAAILNQQELHAAPVNTNPFPAASREEKKQKIEVVPSYAEPQNENVDSIIGNIDPSGAVGFVPSALPYTDRVWELPSVDLLNEPVPDTADRGDVKLREQIIINTLKSFGINAQMKGTSYGPTVTRYAIFAEQGTKITKIAALQYDLALALASPTGSVRIEAPMPGTHFIGIEVPNNTRTPVTFKEVFTADVMKSSKTPLSIVLGKDVGGAPLIYSIGKMPHLLVAGATGSGKSVFLHSILFSILYRCSPLECQLILIDPKRVELVHYQDIPHLKAPVITDIDRAPRALEWVVGEMERRYELFESARAKNIESYNEKSGFQAMAYIVVVIDELGEIMVADPSLVEKSIIRLAQLARATGIHLILTTQRPSTNVVTGLIKANIPARVAFNVTSNTDSRVIIDQPGAEKLMGKGDMLFVPPDAAKPTRIQGVMVAEDEISRLVNYLKSTGFAPDYDPRIFEAVNTRDGSSIGGGSGSGGALDDLFDEAVEVVQTTGKASASYLQRRFSIGYSRAAKILDQLEEAGIIGPARGSKPREILIGGDVHGGSEDFDAEENYPTAPQVDYENSRPHSFN